MKNNKIMTYSELLKVLKLTNKLFSKSYKSNDFSESCCLISSEWLNNNANYSWQKPPNEEDKSTFAICRDMFFYAQKDNIIIDLIIWDGDSYYGNKTNKRCKFKYKLTKDNKINKNMLKYISKLALDVLEYKASNMFELEKEKAEKYGIQQIFKELLTNALNKA